MKARLTAVTVCYFLLVTGTPVCVAFADDDAGLRSVFARGAGERALALGGAYGSVSGDPTALYWNPAGLAGLERTSVAAAHTNLIGMGFHEQFGSLALPTWRLGTFALSLRRYGVDGIEERDDRGTLLADDLRNTESELAFGYGRAIGPAWQVGAALKMQRQELAGQSASGLGLDAGIIVRPGLALGGTSHWAQNLNLGLTFRNIIEPAIRLETEEVRDPSAIRLGGSYAVPLGTQLQALFTVDIEKTKEMDSRLHAGAEVAFLDLIALRVGANNGTLAAGLGATYRNLTLNYAFEDNPLEMVHRFGVGFAFGRTVAERRQAALDLREAELNDRLAKAFAADEQQRVAAAAQAVKSALAAEEFDTALERIRALEVIAPDHPDAAGFEAAALFGRGRVAEGEGEFTAAVIAYQACLRVDPGHERARARLERVTTETERQAQRDENIRNLYRDAMATFAAGDLEQARDLFEQALVLAPGDVEIRKLADHVEESIRLRDEVAAAQSAAREAVGRAESRSAAPVANATPAVPAADSAAATPARKTPPATPTYASLPESRRREIALLYRQGVDAAAAGRREDAIRYWEIVAAAAPDYQQVSVHLKQEYQARGMEAFAEGKLDRAIEIWEQALEIDPRDARTQGYLERAHEHRARIRKIRSEGE